MSGGQHEQKDQETNVYEITSVCRRSTNHFGYRFETIKLAETDLRTVHFDTCSCLTSSMTCLVVVHSITSIF